MEFMQFMLVRLAPFGFVLLWSSSFIAARVGLRYLSPLYFVTVRMVAAAVMLAAVMVALRRLWRPVAGRWGHTSRCRAC
jgi:drug/metabolite transporter (DMT)-like permease